MFQVLSNRIIASKELRIALFSWYSFFKALQSIFLDILPPPLRNLYHRFTLKSLGKKSYIGYGFRFRYPDKIKIGSNVEINENVHLYPSYLIDEARILIGDNCILAPGVQFFCAGQDKNSDSRLDVGGPITIEDGVYIGANSLIRYNVRIGRGATVGAGSIVVNDVRPYSVVAGNPAREITQSPE